MLVLSRKNGESVCIGDDIKVKVLEICGGRVRLGFSAPRNVEIHRSEIACTLPACYFETWGDRDSVRELCSQV